MRRLTWIVGICAAVCLAPVAAGCGSNDTSRTGAAVRRAREAGADAVGLNCSVGSGAMLAMVREAAGSVDRPLVAQPNAGQPRATADGGAYDADPAAFPRDLDHLSADLVGDVLLAPAVVSPAGRDARGQRPCRPTPSLLIVDGRDDGVRAIGGRVARLASRAGRQVALDEVRVGLSRREGRMG